MRSVVIIAAYGAINLSIATGAAHAFSAEGDSALITAATRELTNTMQSKHPEVVHWSISPLAQSRVGDIQPPSSTMKLEVVKTSARSAVRASWIRPDGSHQSRMVWFDVVGTEPIMIATRDLPAGRPLSVADAALADRDVIGMNCSAIQSGDQIERMRARQALRSGAAICREAIEPQPAVARGDDVLVHYVSPRVSVTAKGVAQQDGLVGQRVRVVNPGSKDSFFAVVSAIGEVAVHE